MSKFYQENNPEPLMFANFVASLDDKLYDRFPSAAAMSTRLTEALRDYNDTKTFHSTTGPISLSRLTGSPHNGTKCIQFLHGSSLDLVMDVDVFDYQQQPTSPAEPPDEGRAKQRAED